MDLLSTKMLLAVSLFIICAIPLITGELCRGCSEEKQADESSLSPMQLRQARIELIKRQILQKLRLTDRPKLKTSTLPTVIMRENILGDPNEAIADDQIASDEYYGKTQNIVLLPNNSTYNCSQFSSTSPTCLQFRIHEERLSTDTVLSAHLWVYQPQQPYNLTYITYTTESSSNDTEYTKTILQIDNYSTDLSSSWKTYDLTTVFTDWTNDIFQIQCEGDDCTELTTENDERPFLVIKVDSSHLQRKKREISCEHNSTVCCRDNFYMSFKDVGWDDWIIAPTGYYAYYCRGSCINEVSLSRFHHTTLMQTLIQNDKINISISLCCSPSKMSSISLLYINDDGIIFQKALPNMVVESCDCT